MPRPSKAASAGPSRKTAAKKGTAKKGTAKKGTTGAKKAASTAKATRSSTATKASKTTRSTSTGKATKKTTNATRSTAAAAAKKPTTRTTKATGKTTTSRTTKTATKKAPASKRSAQLDKFLEGQHKALLEERDTYLRQAETLKAEADALAEDMEPGDVQFDEESGEGDTINVERERDLALSAQARAAVEEIDRALAKIDEGTYGICEQCGEPIPRERLKALPYAALCVRCKSGGLGRR